VLTDRENIMTFKKNDLKTRVAASKGGSRTQQMRPEIKRNLELRNLPLLRKQCREFNADREHQKRAGKRSRYWENKKIRDLTKSFDEIFQPYEICDRICIKDGKLVFVEVKRKNGSRSGRELSKKQLGFKKFCEHAGIPYTVEYI